MCIFKIEIIVISHLLLFNGVFSTGGFPKGFLNSIVENPIVQARLQSRWKWEVWDVVPGTHTFNIYMFNLTNPTAFERGAKPRFEQLGPYAYVEHRTKFNVSMNVDNLSVNYQRNFTYTFDPSKSKGTENDLVTTLNIPFIIFSNFANDLGSIGNQAVNTLVGEGEGFLIRDIRVADILFDGFDVRHYAQLWSHLNLPMSSLLSEMETGRYGVLKLKLGSNEGPFKVDSGLQQESNLGKILSWNGHPNLTNWYGQNCNELNGTDGTVVSRYVSNTEPISIFDIDMCRSIDFLYQESSIFENTVPTYGLTLDPKILADPKTAPENQCFCKEPCLKSGVLDISSCRDGAPYIMSFAHFYTADRAYLEAVEGIEPIPAHHQTTMVVQPQLGVVLKYFRRFQWNLKLSQYQNLDYFQKRDFPEIIFPLFWNDDHFELDQDKAELLVAEIANEQGGYASNRTNIRYNSSADGIFIIFSVGFVIYFIIIYYN